MSNKSTSGAATGKNTSDAVKSKIVPNTTKGKNTSTTTKGKTNSQLKKQAAEILAKAKEMGIEQNYMFTTAFERYQEHIAHLRELQKAIDKEGMTVTKEYVKGRANIYVNPAVAAYNQTAGAADKTAQTLMRYIDALSAESEAGDEFDKF